MTHSYKISNMTCEGCIAKVKSELLKHPDILSADVTLPDNAVVTMQKHIPISGLQEAIGANSKYKISENTDDNSHHTMQESGRSWLATYKPLLLIFVFITGVSLIASYNNEVDWKRFMEYFMAAFFLVFSFFKFLDLKGFAESYASYDILAKRIPAYGYIYPFIELALGIAYLFPFDMQVINYITIAVMGFSSIGVIQSVLNKNEIKCACLGTVFNLPMSTVTIVENGLMIAMSIGTLVALI